MPHDVDHAGTHFAHRDANRPEPYFIAINRENGHGHCAVLLAMPVDRNLQQESNLCIFAARPERGIARRIGADRLIPVSLPKIRCILRHDVQRLRFPGGRLRAWLADAARLSSNLC